MKSTDRIALKTMTFADKEGQPVNDRRPVSEEIQRLRDGGMHDAADRMESTCEDTHLDVGRYLGQDPISGKTLGIEGEPVPVKAGK